MEQTKEDLENIKSKVLEYIQKNYSEEEAEKYTKNINAMSDEQLITFLKQQGILKENGETSNQNCIFCSIVNGQVPSTIIAENKEAIAILDINPASLGHTLVIPRKHINSPDKLPQEINNLAEELSISLRNAFNPKSIEVISTNAMGHEIINLLPVYTNETIDSPRQQKTPEELAELKTKIESSTPEVIEEIKKTETISEPEKQTEEINDSNTWLPKRIP